MTVTNDRPDIESVLALLKSPDSAEIVRAAVQLEGSPASLTAAALIGLIDAADDDVRSAVARALGRLLYEENNRAATISALRLLLDDSQGFVRSDAIDSLALMGSRDAKGRIEELLLYDPDPVVRATAAEAQIDLGDHTSEQVLRQALSDGAYITRSYAVMAAGLLGVVGLRSKIEELSETDPSPNVRIEAAIARYRLGDRSGVSVLVGELENADDDTLIVWVNGVSDLVSRKTPLAFAGMDANDLRTALEPARNHAAAPPAGVAILLGKLARFACRDA